MDLLLFVITGVIMFIWLDKYSKVGTVAYSVGFLIVLFLKLFISDASFVVDAMQSVFKSYYLPVRNALFYVSGVTKLDFSAFLFIQLFCFVVFVFCAIVLMSSVITFLKVIKEKISEEKKSTAKKCFFVKYFFVREKIFLKLCRLLS